MSEGRLSAFPREEKNGLEEAERMRNAEAEEKPKWYFGATRGTLCLHRRVSAKGLDSRKG